MMWDDENNNDDFFRWLLANNKSCSQLQDETMAAPLPPVGPHLLRRFTPESLEEIQRRHDVKAKKHTEVWKLSIKTSVTLYEQAHSRPIGHFLTSQGNKKTSDQPATWRQGSPSPLYMAIRPQSYLTPHWRS